VHAEAAGRAWLSSPPLRTAAAAQPPAASRPVSRSGSGGGGFAAGWAAAAAAAHRGLERDLAAALSAAGMPGFPSAGRPRTAGGSNVLVLSDDDDEAAWLPGRPSQSAAAAAARLSTVPVGLPGPGSRAGRPAESAEFAAVTLGRLGSFAGGGLAPAWPAAEGGRLLALGRPGLANAYDVARDVSPLPRRSCERERRKEQRERCEPAVPDRPAAVSTHSALGMQATGRVRD
jgi:hypothetical protein